MPPSCKQTRCHVTKTAGIEVFFRSQKKQERSRGNKKDCTENQDRSQNAPGRIRSTYDATQPPTTQKTNSDDGQTDVR